MNGFDTYHTEYSCLIGPRTCPMTTGCHQCLKRCSSDENLRVERGMAKFIHLSMISSLSKFWNKITATLFTSQLILQKR